MEPETSDIDENISTASLETYNMNPKINRHSNPLIE